MRHALLGGGKRLRPLLCLATAETFGAAAPARSGLLAQACALELVHSYSLIHDDLPCMDDDSERRGQPSCHAKFGEATALLAGDGLLTLAFELIAATGDAAAARMLAEACGRAGMIAGQQQDIANNASSLAALKRMHRLKTGRLFAAAATLGARAAGKSGAELAALGELGLELGLLYQINDDIADEGGKAQATSNGQPRSCVSVLGKEATLRLQQRQGRAVARRLAALAAPDSQLAAMCGRISFPVRL